MGIFSNIKGLLAGSDLQEEAESRIANGVPIRKVINFFRNKGVSEKKIKPIVVKAISSVKNPEIRNIERKLSTAREQLAELEEAQNEIAAKGEPDVSIRERIRKYEQDIRDYTQTKSVITHKKNSMLSEAEMLLPS